MLGLQVKLGQKLNMSQQLQQAIRLLQLSNIELEQEIDLFLESNILLEKAETEIPSADESLEFSTPQEKSETSTEAEAPTEEATELGGQNDEIDWEPEFNDDYSSAASNSDSERDMLENIGFSSADLHSELTWQLNLSPFTERDRIIAETIIDLIEPDGYLRQTLTEIRSGLLKELPDVKEAEIHTVLLRVQYFDPPGVAARNLPECLLIQLMQLPADIPWRAEAIRVLKDFPELLAACNFKKLLKNLDLTEEEFQQVLGLLRNLNPQPGLAFAPSEEQVLIPDVLAYHSKDGWQVRLNQEIIPRIRINQHYANLAKRVSAVDQTVLRKHLSEAKSLIHAVDQRFETLMKVSSAIVAHQQAYFEQGDAAMVPLTMREIAEQVEVHESTVSRITTQKYILTPHGIKELKFFFTNQLATVNSNFGDEGVSAVAVRAAIKRLVAEELPQKPLSDSKIAQLLEKEGFSVARRTVMKYREALSIPSSTERKML